MPKKRLFVDTVIVIEACQHNLWKALTSHFEVETVDTCVVEAQTGPNGLPPGMLASTLKAAHCVSGADRHALILKEQSAAGLDDGERDLYAHLLKANIQGTAVLVSTADKAAVITATKLGWGDQLISLEAAAKDAGVPSGQLSKLDPHFSEEWLSAIRMKIRLGVIP